MSDTSEITNGCLTHYDSRHIQVRADFMGICQYSREEYKEMRKKEPNQECMAKILRLLETLTDHAKAEWKLKTMKAEEKGLAKPKEPERYPIELSNGVLVRLMYYTFGESTVRNSLSYLLEIGYIGYSQEKRNDRPHIWLEQERIQAHLKLQAQVILAGYEFRPPHYQGAISYPDDAISNPRTPISYPEHPKTDPPGCESTDNNIDNKDDISHKTDEKEGSATSAEDRTAHPLINLEMKRVEKRETNPRHPAISISSHSQSLSEEETVKMPAIAKGQHDDGTDHNDIPGSKRDLANHSHSDSAGTAGHARLEQTISTEGRASPAAPTELPPSVQQGAMAMTARQIKAQAERREKELWAIIELERGTKYTSRQREMYENKEGMKCLIADDISDEALREGLRAMDTYQCKNFTVLKFYGWLPNLSAKEPIPKTNGKTAQPFVIDQERNQRNIEAMKARNAEKRRLAASG